MYRGARSSEAVGTRVGRSIASPCLVPGVSGNSRPHLPAADHHRSGMLACGPGEHGAAVADANGSLEAFIDRHGGRIRHGDAKLVLIDELLAAFYERTAGDPPIELMAAVLPGSSKPHPVPSAANSCPRSGAIGDLGNTQTASQRPKGVMIPDRVGQPTSMPRAARQSSVTVRDRVSWLPLYHDMVSSVPVDPDDQWMPTRPSARKDFLAKPGHWMQWISDWGGTATAGPNFSWVLATRALGRMSGLDL